MKVLVVHADETDPSAFVRSATAAGFVCVTQPAGNALDPEVIGPVDLVAIDAWVSPTDVAAVTAIVGKLPGLVVSFDGDQSLLGLHLNEPGHRILVLPASPQVVADAVKAALDRAQIEAWEADADKRKHMAKIELDVMTAHDIQQGFLPQKLPVIEGFTMAAYLKPARDVAGDFYDAFEGMYGRRIGFSVSDVCDKGVGSALFMAIFRTLYRSLAKSNSNLRWLPAGSLEGDSNDDPFAGLKTGARGPAAGSGALLNAVAGTNEYMIENHALAGYFSTTFYGMLDPETGDVLYINAGHNPPVLIRTDDPQELLHPCGPAVGILGNAKFEVRKVTLRPGDALFCYTDGVPEAKDPAGRFLSDDRLFDVLRRPADSAQELIDRVRESIADHVRDAEQYDDITMLAVHRSVDSAPTPS